MTSKKVCRCGKPSVPGLIKGVALCQYHYDEKMFGKEWADKVKTDDIKVEQEFSQAAEWMREKGMNPDQLLDAAAKNLSVYKEMDKAEVEQSSASLEDEPERTKLSELVFYPRNFPVTMTLEEAKTELSSAVYTATALIEQLEGAKLINGNGHHHRQEIARFATELLVKMWSKTK